MKKVYVFPIAMLFGMLFSSGLLSQTYVGTLPANKNVIIEEFTGVQCPNCPQGHQVAQQILDANPGRVWVIGFHPYNSSYTTPYPGDPDFRRHHPDALYTTPYCGSSRFMPSAFINRRIYAGERIQSRTVWASYTSTQLTEASPVNIGLCTTYDEITEMLEMIVEIYFTQTVSDIHSLNVTLAENGLVAQQSGGSPNYVHKHVFREVFTAQWGNPITEPTVQGSFIQKTFSFQNTGGMYNMDECEVTAYIVNDNSTEVVTGIGVHVGEFTVFSAPEPDFEADITLVPVAGSVQYTDLSTGAIDTWEWAFEGGTPATFSGQTPPAIQYAGPGAFQVSLTVSNSVGSNTETKSGYITVDYPPVADFSDDHTLFTGYTEVQFTDLSTGNPTSWEWTFEQGTPSSSTEQNPLVTYVTPGAYEVTLTVTNDFGQDVKIKTVDIQVVSGISQPDANGFNVHPNPVQSTLFIEMPDNISVETIILYDLKGCQVLRHEASAAGKEIKLDVSGLQNGAYILSVISGNPVYTQKIYIGK
ncbi:MAG: Omp28-related outer membrane protein [Bacteroidales bacterium]|nr:Omp28-related outer membrane protein [Bacteroidales bacterium]